MATTNRKSPFGTNTVEGISIAVTKPQYDFLHGWFSDRAAQYQPHVYLSSRALTLSKPVFVAFYEAIEAEIGMLEDKPLRVAKSIKNKLKKQWELTEGETLTSVKHGFLVKLTPMQASHLRLASRVCSHLTTKKLWGEGDDTFKVLDGKKCAYINVDPANVEAEAQVLAEALDILIDYKVSRKPLTALRDALLAQQNVASEQKDAQQIVFDATATIEAAPVSVTLEAPTFNVPAPAVVTPTPIEIKADDSDFFGSVFSSKKSAKQEQEEEVVLVEEVTRQVAGDRTFTRRGANECTEFTMGFHSLLRYVLPHLGDHISITSAEELTVQYPDAWDVADKLSTFDWQSHYADFSRAVEEDYPSDEAKKAVPGYFNLQRGFEVDFKTAIGKHAQLSPVAGGWSAKVGESVLQGKGLSLCGATSDLMELDRLVEAHFPPTEAFVAFGSRKLKMFDNVDPQRLEKFRTALASLRACSAGIKLSIYEKVEKMLPAPTVEVKVPAQTPAQTPVEADDKETTVQQPLDKLDAKQAKWLKSWLKEQGKTIDAIRENAGICEVYAQVMDRQQAASTKKSEISMLEYVASTLWEQARVLKVNAKKEQAVAMVELDDSDAQVDDDKMTMGDFLALTEAQMDEDMTAVEKVVEYAGKHEVYVPYGQVKDLLTKEQVARLAFLAYCELELADGELTEDASEVEDDTKVCFDCKVDIDYFADEAAHQFNVCEATIKEALFDNLQA